MIGLCTNHVSHYYHIYSSTVNINILRLQKDRKPAADSGSDQAARPTVAVAQQTQATARHVRQPRRPGGHGERP